MSECERFERSFQPNVALAPIPQQRRTRLEVTKLEVRHLGCITYLVTVLYFCMCNEPSNSVEHIPLKKP
jgi:hypothetical protein